VTERLDAKDMSDVEVRATLAALMRMLNYEVRVTRGYGDANYELRGPAGAFDFFPKQEASK
jgi:hypothetical protein